MKSITNSMSPCILYHSKANEEYVFHKSCTGEPRVSGHPRDQAHKSAYRRLKHLKHHRGKVCQTCPLNFVGTFQLKTRGNVAVEVSKVVETNSRMVIITKARLLFTSSMRTLHHSMPSKGNLFQLMTAGRWR